MKEIDLLIKFLDANPMVLFVLVFLFNYLFVRFVIYATQRVTWFQMKKKLQKKENQTILEKYDKLIEKMDQMQDQIVAFKKVLEK